MAYTINHYITDWVEESRALMHPDKVLWIDGTETQLEELRREDINTAVEEVGLPLDVRGEALAIAQFAALSNALLRKFNK